jgi:hypothetical protein
MKRILGVLAVVGGLISGTTAHAGAVGGPKYQVTHVNAYSSDSYVVSFYGGESAQVLLEGDGDTDVDLYVYDQYGNLVARDCDGSDLCIVQWTPRWTGPFLIKVVNRGSVYNRYAIVTN